MLQLQSTENDEVCSHMLTWEPKDVLHRTAVCKAACLVSFVLVFLYRYVEVHVYVSVSLKRKIFGE